MPGPSIFGPRERGPVTLVEYDPAWPARFAAERERLLRALGAVALKIEHIGSTAVAGLAAKPIVDILVQVHACDYDGAVASIESAGYVLRVLEPGHRLLRTPQCDVHVHLWDDPADVRRHLAFRDRLRRDPHDRARYEARKRELAPRNWASRDEYADAKSAVIAEILARS
ncbi:MAG TPA: GrpB family protein [Candidatus Acidoferrales bacterium]|nr:GrpB family protein [Candidatus Acidoferrales bacterium]